MRLFWKRSIEPCKDEAYPRPSGWLWLGGICVGMAGAALWRIRTACTTKPAGQEMAQMPEPPAMRAADPTVVPAPSVASIPEPRPIHPAATRRQSRPQTRNMTTQASRQPDLEQPISKMMAGGDDLRSHDFEFPPQPDAAENQHVARDADHPEPEQVHSGGKVGEIEGDRPPIDEVGVIMDQDMDTPDFAQER